MDFTSFREKLAPFFTPEQIGHLDTEAIQSAIDAHGTADTCGLTKLDYLRTLHYMGRCFICEMIANYIESDPVFIERLAGSPIPWERRKNLIMQIDIEW